MDTSKITNNPDLKFNSLEDEKFRVYEFPNGTSVKIDCPVALAVSASGGHRVLDVLGVAHYIPSGWHHLYWQPKEGTLPFAF